MEAVQETYNALDAILKDQATFDEVVGSVFESIDKDHSGTLEKPEVEEFIKGVCGEMGIKKLPGSDNIEEVFKSIDTDHSNNISKAELGSFLKTLFVEQKKELAKQLGK